MSELVARPSKYENCFGKNPYFADKKWFNDFRANELQLFLQNGLPTRKDELWKYTEVKSSYIPDRFGEIRDLASQQKFVAGVEFSRILFVFVNGHFSEKLSNLDALPSDVVLCTISQALNLHEDKIKPYLLREFDVKQFDVKQCPFATLNSALMTDGMFLQVPPNLSVETPIHLLFIHAEQNEFMTNPRNLILADKNSQITLIEEHVSHNAQGYFTNTLTDIVASDNARVNYYKIQDNDLSATHIADVFINQQKDSCVKTFSFAKGSALAREDIQISQQASGAEISSHGLYILMHDNQHIDHHVHVDHFAAHGTSSMLYKGILDKKSRAVFNGKVFVHPNTKHINAHQANHNLLLSKEAEIFTKPELEIYAEDVKCTHGATVGQLDNESLFYLRSRGIEKNAANRMLLRGFEEEVYNKIEDEKIKQYIRQRMSHHDD